MVTAARHMLKRLADARMYVTFGTSRLFGDRTLTYDMNYLLDGTN